MTIFGNNASGSFTMQDSGGRKIACKKTLASAQTLQELHAWILGDTGNNYILHLHADSGGHPGARLAYTSSIAVGAGGSPVEISQSGFSVALAAGDYWLGFTSQNDTGSGGCKHSGGSTVLEGLLGGATYNPPSDPFGTRDYSSTGDLSVWAVVGAAASTPVADFTGTPLTGVAPYSVAFTDSSTNTPTSWAWDFGDGGTSSSQNPSHTYTAPGVYTVVLVATNSAGSNTKTRTGYVTVSSAAPAFVPQIAIVL